MAQPSDVWASPPEKSAGGEWASVPLQPRPARSVGDRVTALAAWAACGFAFAASLVLFPIGLLALPIPIALAARLANRGRSWPEALGVAPGASAFLGYVAYRNRDSVPCDGSFTIGGLSPGQESGCGGTAPEPWLVGALLVLALAAAIYALALLAEYQRRE